MEVVFDFIQSSTSKPGPIRCKECPGPALTACTNPNPDSQTDPAGHNGNAGPSWGVICWNTRRMFQQTTPQLSPLLLVCPAADCARVCQVPVLCHCPLCKMLLPHPNRVGAAASAPHPACPRPTDKQLRPTARMPNLFPRHRHPCEIVHPDAGCRVSPQHTHTLTPVKAVPAMNHAKGSRYQGDTLIRYRLAATLLRVMAMALHAFRGLISKTCTSDDKTARGGQDEAGSSKEASGVREAVHMALVHPATGQQQRRDKNAAAWSARLLRHNMHHHHQQPDAVAYLWWHALDDVSECDTIGQLCTNGLVAPLVSQCLALLKRQLADGHGSRDLHSCC